MLRPGLGYFSQNLAFLINIQRWLILLSGCSLDEAVKFNYHNEQNLLDSSKSIGPERHKSTFLQNRFKVIIFGSVLASILFTVL